MTTARRRCRLCGADCLVALSPSGCTILLDPQISMVGDYQLATGPGGLAFAVRDPTGTRERYSRHDGGTCSGVRAGGEPPA